MVRRVHEPGEMAWWRVGYRDKKLKGVGKICIFLYLSSVKTTVTPWGIPTNKNLFKNVYKNIIMYKQSIYILNNPYRETFKNTSGDFGSDIIGWDLNASLHTLFFPLHLYSILTPQAAAVFPKNRKAIVQQMVSRIFFVVFFLRKLVKYMSSVAFG